MIMELNNHTNNLREQTHSTLEFVHTVSHSNEIEDIISSRPPSIVRWGTLYFFLLLSIVTLLCWFIPYPDVVSSKAKLNGVNTPKSIVSRVDGKLVNLFIQEYGKVIKGQVLGHMESIGNPIAISHVSDELNQISELIKENRTDEIINLLPDSAPDSSHFIGQLGEVQNAYQIFMQSFISFRDYLSSGYFLQKKRMLNTDLSNIRKLHSVLLRQKTLLEQDLSLSSETFEANESLAKDKVISALDYRNEKSKLIGKELSLPQVNISLISNESQQNDKAKEIAELENQIKVQKNIFIQALLTMKSHVESWETKYVLKAPESGTVSFAGFVQKNQEIKNGQSLFYIEPDNTIFFAEMAIPQYNFGKVQPGQKVLLKFSAYPHEQYGSVTGKVEGISTIPTDSGYLAKISLPTGLVTNYNKTLQYRNGLIAQAEIITEDTRLLEKFYYSIVKHFR